MANADSTARYGIVSEFLKEAAHLNAGAMPSQRSNLVTIPSAEHFGIVAPDPDRVFGRVVYFHPENGEQAQGYLVVSRDRGLTVAIARVSAVELEDLDGAHLEFKAKSPAHALARLTNELDGRTLDILLATSSGVMPQTTTLCPIGRKGVTFSPIRPRYDF